MKKRNQFLKKNSLFCKLYPETITSKDLTDQGITLIALVITIIVLLILAGVSLRLIAGGNGIIGKAENSVRRHAISAAKEKVELAIHELRMEEQLKGNAFTKESLRLLKGDNNEISVKSTEKFPVEVVCDVYEFEIDENYNVVYIGEADYTILTYITEPENYINQDAVTLKIKVKNPKGIKEIHYPNEEEIIQAQGKKQVDISYLVSENGIYTFKVINSENKEETRDIKIEGLLNNKVENCLKFKGRTYIKTNIHQSQLLKNNAFTIAARVKINRAEQASVDYMNILGNHIDTSGMNWQFNGTSTWLNIWGCTFDYSPFYDQWTNIVYTFNGQTTKVFVNGELVTYGGRIPTIYGNIFIGEGYTSLGRAMKGAISCVKIWNRNLEENEIKLIKYDRRNTVQNDELIMDMIFENMEDIQKYGNMIGSNYEFIKIE